MKLKGVKTLQTVTIIIQAVALVIIILMTLLQSPIKMLLYSDNSLTEMQSIPIGSLLSTIPFLLVYIMGFVLMTQKNVQGRE